MPFRRKTRGTVPGDILDLVRKHKVLDVIFADNILHPADIAQVFERMPADLDLRMHLEVKANLKREEIRRLRDHGVWHLQPGIESLAERPLALMRKGVKPWQNLRFLRDAEELGVTCSWNILLGFPTEEIADYESMLSAIPALHHLQPPGSVAVLGLVRYSPLFFDTTLGVEQMRPTSDVQHVYAGLEDSDLRVLADVYEPDSEDVFAVGREVALLLEPMVDAWKSAHQETFLLDTVNGGEVRLDRVVAGQVTSLMQFRDSHLVKFWDSLRGGRTRVGIARDMASLSSAHARDVSDLLAEVEGRQLVFCDENSVVTLPARYQDHVPYRIG